VTGRWTQQDNLESLGDPAQGNRFAFTAGDPVNNVDPNGRFTFFDGVLITFAVVGLFAGGVGVAAALPGVAVAAGLVDTSIAVTVGLGIPATAATIGCAFSESC
jgi:hypothetical protein